MKRSVLITGASSGIGEALARQFAAHGDTLILVARRTDRLEALAAELRELHGTQSSIITRDLAEPHAAAGLVGELDERQLDIDVVVNNAGFGALGRVADLDAERQADMIRLNISALFELTRFLLPRLLNLASKGDGVKRGVLNIGSMAGFLPGPNMAVYYATKAFVLHFTEALAEECRANGTGLHVSCLCPGPTKTEFGKASGMDTAKFFRAGTMSVQRVAAAGFAGFQRGRIIVIPGFSNRLGTVLVKLLPRVWVRRTVQKMQRPGESDF